MFYLSVCSGIEAATVAWMPLGWEAVAFAEIEAFPRAVLKHHFPDVPNWGDMTKFHDWPDATFDVLVGGTPCQSFSVAGLRKGMDDPRGNLALTYLALADRYRPRWIVWENVPGVLSSNEGRDFGAFLGGVEELGYGWSYRTLDAQYFGLAQRRKRVFVVGYLGDWRPPTAVLFERESLQGHPAPRRQAGEGTARSLRAQSQSSHRDDTQTYVPAVSPALKSRDHKGPSSDGDGDGDGAPLVAQPLRAGRQYSDMGDGQANIVTHALRADGFDASEDGTGRGTPIVPIDMRQASRGATMTNNRAPGSSGGAPGTGIGEAGDPCPTLADSHVPAVAFSCKDHGADVGELSPTLCGMGHDSSHANAGGQVAVAFQEAQTGCREYPTAGTIRANGPGHDPVGTRVREGMAVRRLTPRECERLQGFPDDYTLIPMTRRLRKAVDAEMAAYYRRTGQELSDDALCRLAADGPRYKALGNSMAVPVVRWIGERIAMVDKIARAVMEAA